MPEMRILIAGGTRFVGRHITQAAVDAGHEVTVFHRGHSGTDLFPQVTHLTGDRDGDLFATGTGLGALAEGEWDATIDVSAYFPRQVRTLAQALDGRGGHYVYISSTSAYSVPITPNFSENSPLAELADPSTEEITDQTYGGLKVACERLATELYGPDRVTIVRPTYVVGPYDHSYRLTWWIDRIARGGEVLAPGPKDGPIQVIDARDMGRWIVSLADGTSAAGGTAGGSAGGRPLAGVFHAASPAPPYGFGDLLEDIVAAVGPPRTTLTWVEPEFLLARGEDAESLPLWPGGDPESAINTADPAAAYAAGLAPRPIRQTIADIHAAELAAPTPVPPGTGISAAHEADLLTAWTTRRD